MGSTGPAARAPIPWGINTRDHRETGKTSIGVAVVQPSPQRRNRPQPMYLLPRIQGNTPNLTHSRAAVPLEHTSTVQN